MKTAEEIFDQYLAIKDGEVLINKDGLALLLGAEPDEIPEGATPSSLRMSDELLEQGRAIMQRVAKRFDGDPGIVKTLQYLDAERGVK